MSNSELTRQDYIRALLSQKKDYQANGIAVVNPSIGELAQLDTSFQGVKQTEMPKQKQATGFDGFMQNVLGFIDEIAARFGAGFVNGWEGGLDLIATGLGALGWKDAAEWAKQDIGKAAAEWSKTAFGLGAWYDRIAHGKWSGEEWGDIGKGFIDLSKSAFFMKNDLQDMRQLADKHYGANDEVLGEMNVGDWQAGEFLGGIAHSVGFMLPSIMTAGGAGAAGAASGVQKGVSLATLGLGAAGQGSQEALNEGAEPVKALGYGVASGTVEVASELVVGKILGAMGLGVNKVAGVVGKKSTSSAVSKVARKELVKEISKAAFEEGAEEVFSAVLEPLTKSIYKGEEAFKDSKGRFVYTSPEFWVGADGGNFNESVVGQFTSGAITGGLMNSVAETKQYKALGKDGYLASKSLANAYEAASEAIKLERQGKTDTAEYKAAVEKAAKLAQEANDARIKFMDNATPEQKKAFGELLNNPEAFKKALEKDAEEHVNKNLDNFINNQLQELTDLNKTGARSGFNELQGITNSKVELKFEKNVNPHYNSNTNTITLNSDLLKTNGGQKLVHEYLGHAMSYTISNENQSALYEKIIETKAGREITKDIDGIEEYKNLKKGSKPYMEEVVARYLEKAFSNETQGKNLVQQLGALNQLVKGRTLFDRIFDLFRKNKTFKANDAILNEYAKMVNNFLKASSNNSKVKKVLAITDKLENKEELTKAEKKFYEEHKEAIDAIVEARAEQEEVSYSAEQSQEKDSKGNVLTKSQVKFFKDSKVRDKNGNLLIMYHGSPSNFTVFDENKIGYKTDANNPMNLEDGEGFYFTNLESESKEYGKNVFKVYLNIKNPFIAASTHDLTIGEFQKTPVGKELMNLKNEGVISIKEFVKVFKNPYRLFDTLAENLISPQAFLSKCGYDGVFEDNGDDNYLVAVAFNSNQIKNVDNVNPTSNNDIRYSVDPVVGKYELGDSKNKAEVRYNKAKETYEVVLDKAETGLKEGRNRKKTDKVADYGKVLTEAVVGGETVETQTELTSYVVRTEDSTKTFSSKVEAEKYAEELDGAKIEEKKRKIANYSRVGGETIKFDSAANVQRYLNEMNAKKIERSFTKREKKGQLSSFNNEKDAKSFLKKEGFKLKEKAKLRNKYSRNSYDYFVSQEDGKINVKKVFVQKRADSIVLNNAPTQEQLHKADATPTRRIKLNDKIYVAKDGKISTYTAKQINEYDVEYKTKQSEDIKVKKGITQAEFKELKNNQDLEITSVKLRRSYEVKHGGITKVMSKSEYKNVIDSYGAWASNHRSDVSTQKIYKDYFLTKDGRHVMEVKVKKIGENKYEVLKNDGSGIFKSEEMSYKGLLSYLNSYPLRSTVSVEEVLKEGATRVAGEPKEKIKKQASAKELNKQGEKTNKQESKTQQVKQEKQTKKVSSKTVVENKPKEKVVATVSQKQVLTKNIVKAAAHSTNARVFDFSEVEAIVKQISKGVLNAAKLSDSNARVSFNGYGVESASTELFYALNKAHVTEEQVVDKVKELFDNMKINVKTKNALAKTETTKYLGSDLMDDETIKKVVHSNIAYLLSTAKESKVAAITKMFRQMRKALTSKMSNFRQLAGSSMKLRRKISKLRSKFDYVNNRFDIKSTGLEALVEPFKRLHRTGDVYWDTKDFLESVNKLLDEYTIENWEDQFPELPYFDGLRVKMEQLKASAENGNFKDYSSVELCNEVIDDINKLINSVEEDSVNKYAPNSKQALMSIERSGYGKRKNLLSSLFRSYKRGFAPAYLVVEEMFGGNSRLGRLLTYEYQDAVNKKTLYTGTYHEQINKKLKELGIKRTFDTKKIMVGEHELTADQAIGLYISLQVQDNYNAINESGAVYYNAFNHSFSDLAKVGEAERLKGMVDSALPDNYKKFGDWLLNTINGKVKSEYIDWYKEFYSKYKMSNEIGDINDNKYWTISRYNSKMTNVEKAVSSLGGIFPRSQHRTQNTALKVAIGGGLNTFNTYIEQLGSEKYTKPIYREALASLNISLDGSSVSEAIKQRDQRDSTYLNETLRDMLGALKPERGVLDKLVGSFSVAKLSLNVGSMLKQFASAFTSNIPIKNTFKALFAKMFHNQSYKSEYETLVKEIGGLKYRMSSAGVVEANADSMVGFTKNIARKGMFGVQAVDMYTISTGVYSLMNIAKNEFNYEIGSKENIKFVKEHWSEYELSQIGNTALSRNEIVRGEDGLTRYIFGFLQGANRAALGSQLHKFGLWSRNRNVDFDELQSAKEKAEAKFKDAESKYNEIKKQFDEEEEHTNESIEKMENARNEFLQEKAELLDYESRLADYNSFKIAGGKKIVGNMTAGILAQGVFVALINALMKRIKGKKDWDEFDIAEEGMNLALAIGVDWVPLVNTVSNLVKGYEVTVPAVEIMNQVADIFGNWKNGDTRGVIRQIAFLVSDLTGLPTQTVYQYIYGSLKMFDPAIAYELNSVLYGASLQSTTNAMKTYAERKNEPKTASMIGLIMSKYKMGNSSDKINKELASLYIDGYNSLPTTPLDSYTDENGQTIELTQKQIEQFKNYYSQASKDISSLLDIAEYKTATSEEKSKAIKKLYDIYYQYAKVKVIGAATTSKLVNVVSLTKGNIQLAKYIMYLQKISSIVETSKATRKTLVVRYINKIRGMSAKEKSLLMYLAGYSVSGNSRMKLISYLVSKGASRKQLNEIM